MGVTPRLDFRRLLSDQALASQEGLEAVESFLRRPSPEALERVRASAAAAAKKASAVLEALDQRPPAAGPARRRIFTLVRALEAMVEAAKSAAEETLRFAVSAEGPLQDMARGARQAAEDLAKALECLERKDPAKASDHVVQAKRGENWVEHVRRGASAEKARNAGPVTALALQSIFGRFSAAALHGDEAADIIGELVVEPL